MIEDTVSGYLELQLDTGSEWHRMYCVLKNLQLQCYDAEAENFSRPEITIPVTKVSQHNSKKWTTWEMYIEESFYIVSPEAGKIYT